MVCWGEEVCNPKEKGRMVCRVKEKQTGAGAAAGDASPGQSRAQGWGQRLAAALMEPGVSANCSDSQALIKF